VIPTWTLLLGSPCSPDIASLDRTWIDSWVAILVLIHSQG
jgi:hypothetical protein